MVFQQQIGRGLRLHPRKESCLVLDFVGQHRASFRLDRLLGALTGLSRRALRTGAEGGFSGLPLGCHVQLQPRTREQVLASLRALAGASWRNLRTELQAYAARNGAAVSLPRFLHELELTTADIYREQGNSGWTLLKRSAGLIAAEPAPEERYFSGRLHALRHVDDTTRLTAICDLASGRPVASLLLQMLAYQVDGAAVRVGSGDSFARRILNNPLIAAELGELADVLEAQVSLLPPLPDLLDTPLCLHARYGVREILTAVGWLTATERPPFQAGVLPLWDRKMELLFVTLDKTSGYHERIAYRDFAVDAATFHWQSQNSAAPQTPSGRRYRESATNGWRFQLFVRETPDDAYLACGPVSFLRSEGERPMTIWWRLQTPLTAALFARFSVLRGA